jgi:hypothetical protein
MDLLEECERCLAPGPEMCLKPLDRKHGAAPKGLCFGPGCYRPGVRSGAAGTTGPWGMAPRGRP